jgi:hypothetical protein
MSANHFPLTSGHSPRRRWTPSGVAHKVALLEPESGFARCCGSVPEAAVGAGLLTQRNHIGVTSSLVAADDGVVVLDGPT